MLGCWEVLPEVSAAKRMIDWWGSQHEAGPAQEQPLSVCILSMSQTGPWRSTEVHDPMIFLQDSLRRKQGGRGRLAFPPLPILFAIKLGVHVECKKLLVPNIIFASSRKLSFIIFINNCLNFLNAFRSISNSVLRLGLSCWHLSRSRRVLFCPCGRWKNKGSERSSDWPMFTKLIRDWAGTWTQTSWPSLCLTAQICISTPSRVPKPLRGEQMDQAHFPSLLCRELQAPLQCSMKRTSSDSWLWILSESTHFWGIWLNILP